MSELIEESVLLMNAAALGEEDPIMGGSTNRWPTNLSKTCFAPFLLASIVFIVVVVWFATSHTSSGPIPQLSQENDLTPPKLISRPDLNHLHYCGLNPDDPGALPFIPTLDDNRYELVLAQGFIRHGDRFFDSGKLCWAGQEKITYDCQVAEISVPGTNMSDIAMPKPARLYRKRFMTNRNDFEGNCMVGQLSKKGYSQERSLGAIFHQAYVGKLLDPDLNPNEVFFRSDDVPRTVMSAQAFISGMYPADHTTKYDTAIIDIWTMDFDRETELSNAHECPGLNDHIAKAIQSFGYQNHIKTFTENLYKRLSPVIGVPVANITDMQFDCLFVSACGGTPLPEAFTSDLIRDLEEDARFRFYYPLQYPNRIDGTRLAAGPLVREIFERMTEAIDKRSEKRNQPYVKFSLYSGHDTGPIMLLLSVFAVEDNLWAPYASYITLELYQHKMNQEYAVRFVYNGQVLRFPEQSDSDLISFSSFREIVLPVIPSREECPDIYAV